MPSARRKMAKGARGLPTRAREEFVEIMYLTNEIIPYAFL